MQQAEVDREVVHSTTGMFMTKLKKMNIQEGKLMTSAMTFHLLGCILFSINSCTDRHIFLDMIFNDIGTLYSHGRKLIYSFKEKSSKVFTCRQVDRSCWLYVQV